MRRLAEEAQRIAPGLQGRKQGESPTTAKRSERVRAVRCKPCNKSNMFKVLQPLQQAFSKRTHPSGPQAELTGDA